MEEVTPEEMLRRVALRDLLGWKTRKEVEEGVRLHIQAFDAAQTEARSVNCHDRSGKKLLKPFPFLRGMTAQQLATPAYGKWFDMFVRIHREHNDKCVHCGASND